MRLSFATFDISIAQIYLETISSIYGILSVQLIKTSQNIFCGIFIQSLVELQ